MINNNTPKLFRLLAQLSADEWSNLLYFARSHYHYTRPEVQVLLEYLKVCFQKKEEEYRLNKNAIFAHIYPQRLFHDSTFRLLLSDAVKTIETFAAFEQLKYETHTRAQLKLRFFRTKNTDKDYKQMYQYERKLQKKQIIQDAAYYKNTFELEDEYRLFLEKTFVRKQENFKTALFFLDVHYILKKMQFACEIINHHQIIAGDNTIWLLDALLKELRIQGDYLQFPIVNIYYHIYCLLTDTQQQDHYFTILKDMLQAASDNIGAYELRDMYFYMMNFCTRQINAGRREYLREIFGLYQITLNNRLIFQGKYLSPWHYKNISTVALLLGEFDWVKDFIKTYRQHLSEEFADNAYTYNLARYHFYTKAYKKTIQLLHGVEYQDIFYALDSKSLLIKTYYHLDETDALFSLMDSFRKYLHRNKLISAIQRANYLNMLRFINRLVLINPRDRKKRAALRLQIENSKQVADKTWLLAQL